MKKARPMAVKPKHLHVVKFFGLKFIIILIGQFCDKIPGFVPKGEIENLREGKSSSVVRKNTISYICDAFGYTIVSLGYRHKGTSRIDSYLNPTSGPFFHF